MRTHFHFLAKWKFTKAGFVAAWCSFSSLQLSADTVVAPNQFANSEAPGGTGAFGGYASGSYREQIIYNASEFLSAMPQGGIITEIAYRLDATQGQSVNAATPPLQIRISTTSSTAPVFPFPWDANVGADVRTVYSGSLSIVAAPTGQAPNPFDIRIPLSSAFPYDPRAGNLLIDTTYSGVVAGSLVLDPGSARHLGSLEKDTAESIVFPGFVIQLTFLPIPEPSTVAILVLGVLIIIPATQRKRKASHVVA